MTIFKRPLPEDTTQDNKTKLPSGTGIPGAEKKEEPEPEAAAILLTATSVTPRIGKKELEKAIDTLGKYKQGKANLEDRVVEDELWWELRHWEAIRRNKLPGDESPEPSSAWLFNAILNKHADAMDNYPEPIVLPREASDREAAQTLSSVLPVVMEYNEYEKTYSENWWEKLKHGTAIYGVFWNTEKENGLGDIDIRSIDLLKIFWEPGVTDIQKSRNLFLVELVDKDILEEQYPEHKGKLGGSVIDVKQYIYDDTVDISNKSVVVDWYYKVRSASGKTLLHYAKFVGDTLLFASENEPQYQERGWYDHGLYPVVLDALFPEKGTPVGFGYVSICKDPQLYIDKLSANILENSMMSTKKRFFVSSSTAINKDQFLDWGDPLVEVEGEIDDRRIKEIETQPLSGIYLNVAQMKIDEMKETAANRDASSGGAGAGITAAAAIAALQEAGNKASRDMISATYRAHTTISTMCVELMRQFYDEARSFRITGTTQGEMQFSMLDNKGLRDQELSPSYPGQELEPDYIPMYRRPIFDIKITAQKKNPFSRMEQNERAIQLYQLGFYNPERAQESLTALNMMDFEGIEKVKESVQNGQTLLKICENLSQQLDQMAAIVQAITGKGMGQNPENEQQMQTSAPGGSVVGQTMGQKIQNAQEENMTNYGKRIAEKSKPDMQRISDAAKPRS